MGMSIEESEALEILKDIRLNANYIQNRESRTGMACKLAIDIIHKYQKIQEIMDELNGNFYGSYLKDRQALEKIYEVVEDGNDN